MLIIEGKAFFNIFELSCLGQYLMISIKHLNTEISVTSVEIEVILDFMQDIKSCCMC
jgi:hypothetical protein